MDRTTPLFHDDRRRATNMMIGNKTHPNGDSSALKVYAQYEFTAALSSDVVAKAVTVDGLGVGKGVVG